MKLTPDVVLEGYRMGIFPMADPSRKNAISWYAPDPRAVLPIAGLHVPNNLQKLVRRGVFDVTTDRSFPDVIRACADRESTWISDEIVRVYSALHEMGHAHSVECRLEGRLVGGLYGVSLGGAFFGESMFHRVPDASKVALVHLVRRLHVRGYALLDTQFTTPHLVQFGVVEIPRFEYERRLRAALRLAVSWDER
jgi:leucyl/phenylalanyl-tRNA---protein transferase